MLETGFRVAFWSALVVLGYTFCLYPLAIFLLSRLSRRRASLPGELLDVSLIIPILNEESVVEEKLANALALDYPPDKLEIVFASDGSTDRSVEILRRCKDPRVRVIEFPVNRGKAVVLNETVPDLRGEIAVLSDASGILSPSSLQSVVPHFHDPEIGVVCGIYGIHREGRSRVDSAESTYHGFEMQLRMWEARVRTTLSGTGALCAFRKAEYEPLAPGLINDDFVLPARMALRGKRVVYEPRARIQDRIKTSMRGAFRRRVRMVYGNWQQLKPLRGLLDPRRGYLFWVFMSHKMLRMALPYLLLVLFLSSWALATWLFLGLAGGLVLLLLLGLAGLLLDQHFKGHNPLGFIVLVFLYCVAVFVGSARFFGGKAVRW